MAQPARPLRADAARNRARVLDVAYETFAAEGLSVPIDEIARRAGVGAGTVYRHFPSREELVVAARARFEERRGKIYQDEELWETWSAGFVEWLVTEYVPPMRDVPLAADSLYGIIPTSLMGGNRTIDLDFGADGALYVASYSGSNFTINNNNTGVWRFAYTGGDDTPGPDPQYVTTNSGKVDFNIGRSGGVSYEWTFEDDHSTATGASVVGIEREGHPIINPGPDEELKAGDRVLLIWPEQQLAGATPLLSPSPKP